MGLRLFATTRRTPTLMLAALLICGAPSAGANAISFVDSFRNQSYTQTGNGNSLIFSQAFFSGELNSVSANAYSSVTMTYPGPGSPVSLSEVSPPSTLYRFQTPSLPTKAAMDAAFPVGTYTFTTNTPDTANLVYAADDYPLSLPYLTGTDFSSLQGMNPANPFTFDLSPFITGATANSSFIFLTIFDFTSGTFVFSDDFLPSTTPSVTLPANTLAFGHSFGYEVIFDNRDTVSGTGAANFPPFIGFDIRTDGSFTSEQRPVPEPTTLALLGLGLAGLGFSRRRKQ